MYKILSFVLILSVFTFSESYGMVDERKAKTLARLQKKLEKSKDDGSIGLQKQGETLFETITKMQSNDFVTNHEPTPLIDSSIIYINATFNIRKNIKKIKPTFEQFHAISIALEDLDKNLTNIVLIRENFENSLQAGMKYQERVHGLLQQECKFHNKIISSFPANQAFASDVLPFTHKLRKELIFPLYVVSDGALKMLPDCHKHLKGTNIKNPILLIDTYVKLFDLCALCHRNSVSMLSQFDNNKALRIKYRRLASSLLDGEIELLLKYSNSLLPYVKIIQNFLQVDGFDEVFRYKKSIEDILDKQREENQRGPTLLSKYRVFLQERAQQKSQSFPGLKILNRPLGANIEASSEKLIALPDEYTEAIQSPVNSNEKSNYRKPSAQEEKTKRKREAKELKKANPVPSPSKELEPKSSSEKEPNQLEQKDFFIEIGGGPFKIYNKVMDQSFKGTIEKIVLLIEALGGSVDDGRSGSRIKIELPCINRNKRAYLDILPPEEEDESEKNNSHVLTTNDTNSTASSSTTVESVMHTPHKGKSKKLRFYHTMDVRELLMDAGYTPNVVHKGSQK